MERPVCQAETCNIDLEAALLGPHYRSLPVPILGTNKAFKQLLDEVFFIPFLKKFDKSLILNRQKVHRKGEQGKCIGETFNCPSLRSRKEWPIIHEMLCTLPAVLPEKLSPGEFYFAFITQDKMKRMSAGKHAVITNHSPGWQPLSIVSLLPAALLPQWPTAWNLTFHRSCQ